MHAEIFESAENGTLKVKPPPPIPISCRTGLLGRSHPGFRETLCALEFGNKDSVPPSFSELVFQSIAPS